MLPKWSPRHSFEYPIDLRTMQQRGHTRVTNHTGKNNDKNRTREKKKQVGGVGNRWGRMSYFVYSRKPCSVSTRGSERPERITLRGSPRSGAVYCGGVSAQHQQSRLRSLLRANGDATDIKETATIDAGVSPSLRDVHIFPETGR